MTARWAHAFDASASGFLVIVPRLGSAVGIWAPVAMAGVVALAYLDARNNDGGSIAVVRIETLSSIALAISYFVSVTFYLRLLASLCCEPWATAMNSSLAS